MAKNTKPQVEETLAADEALSKTEQFLEKHQKLFIWALVVVIVIAAGIVLFRTQYIAPKNEDAANKLAQCVYYFEQDSFALALNGDGMNEGFADIADGYKLTETSNLACCYAAVCCFKLGQYQDAIDYLDRYHTESVNFGPATITLKGDCYVFLGELDKAVKLFEEAAGYDNVLTAPRALNKAAICYEKQGDYAKAEQCYTTIKDKYFDSPLAQDMDKRIENCKIHASK
ncbi:MAG: tetratricopeptide repeat protein [bacterium]|nr:tetratricopeptide repeat protein [Candidatus Minthenecus merdequi]